MKWFSVLFIICYELSENRFFVSMKPTDEASETTPETESGSSVALPEVPRDSDFSGTCPQSSCLDNVTEQRNEFPPIGGCYCDKLCIGLRDCCEDSIFYNEEEQRQPRTIDCVHDLQEEPNGYYVDRGCPRSWKDLQIVENCAVSRNTDYNTADLRLMVPVTSVSTGVTYGNIFCALCNNAVDFIVWDIKVEDFCVADQQIDEDSERTDDPLVTENYTVKEEEGSTEMESNYEVRKRKIKMKNASDLKFNGKNWYIMENQTEYVCQLYLSKPKDLKINICLPNEALKSLAMESCWENWTDSTVSNQCQGAYAMVYHNPPGEKSVMYKNKFCAYCNGLSDTQLFCDPSTISVIMSVFGILEGRALSVTFDFNIDLTDTQFCQKVSTKGQNLSATEKRFCPTEAEQAQFSENTSNWFFTAYTSIALLVSLISLISHLIVFVVVKKLHTIGGKNLASFCLALVLAYCSFLAGNYLEGKACFVDSIVTYYSFLSAFSWMFIISFDIWKTFRDLTKKFKSPRNSKYKFLIYSVWSWMMPALVVAVAVYFDLSKSHPALAPHFGENGCWFHNGYSLLLFFVVPVSVIILINFILFLHVSLILRNNQCASANQKAYVDYKLYARIGLLTGFTWITGFIAGYFQNMVIWYIFIVLNTSQGVFIFLAFTCKKQIISRALIKIGLSCCLTAECMKLEYSTVISSVKTEKESETEMDKNFESKLI